MGDWKLVSSYRKPWELYNLAEDRTELQDRATQDPARDQSMTAEYGRWAARCQVVPWDQLNPPKA